MILRDSHAIMFVHMEVMTTSYSSCTWLDLEFHQIRSSILEGGNLCHRDFKQTTIQCCFYWFIFIVNLLSATLGRRIFVLNLIWEPKKSD